MALYIGVSDHTKRHKTLVFVVDVRLELKKKNFFLFCF